MTRSSLSSLSKESWSVDAGEPSPLLMAGKEGGLLRNYPSCGSGGNANSGPLILNPYHHHLFFVIFILFGFPELHAYVWKQNSLAYLAAIKIYKEKQDKMCLNNTMRPAIYIYWNKCSYTAL